MKLKSKILIIAGSDSSGGAGIQADIKTVTSLGSYAMTAITAITSQNTTGVFSISKVPLSEIKNQIEFTSKDIKPDAIKIGMLHSSKVINVVLNSLIKIKVKKIILDPVMVAKGGKKLIDNKSIGLIRSKLMKKVSLITPNIPEAEILSKVKIKSIVQKLKKYHEWLIKYRDPKNTGLVSILHPWESGYDNSPLWDYSMNEVKVCLLYTSPSPRDLSTYRMQCSA